jgi:hypothetical protein
MPPNENQSVVSDADILERWDRGERAADIARAYGLTRARIDQRLKRNGRRGVNRNGLPASERLLIAAQSVFGIDELAMAMGISASAVGIALDKHGIRDVVNLVLQSNRRARADRNRIAQQQPFIQQIRLLASRVGHTPTIDELELESIFHSRLGQVFGSAPAAMRAAGLKPNTPGAPPFALPADFHNDAMPTVDADELLSRATRLISSGALTTAPSGNSAPPTRPISSTAYVRDPAVAAWILQLASGICEACGGAGYETDSGRLYLEVHHMLPLSEGGEDTVANTIAVCETCHGKLHRWIGRNQMQVELKKKLPRLA